MAPQIPAAPLPVSNPTSSYWLSQPHDTLADYRASDTVPSHVDTAIVGSGISGALIAHDLLTRRPSSESSVLMLEARSICSGASGRNGGHIKPDCYKNYSSYEDRYGAEVAKALCRFELENMHDTVRFIHEQGLAQIAELVLTRSVDVFMNENSWKQAQSSLKRYRDAGGNLGEIRVHDQKEAEERFRFSGVCGAVSYPACSLWPQKLAVAIIEQAVSRGLQLYTHTPALRVLPSQDGGRWLIRTSRGDVTCNRVFHATNGYISNLVPGLAGKVVPCKGHVVALRSNDTWSSRPLGHTAGVQWGEDFDYMIQRHSDGKPLIYGGGDLAHPRGLLGPIGDADDSATTPQITRALQEFPKSHMKRWASDEASLRYAWSGIMGFTADGLPFVGELPRHPGQFLAAGYTGRGMARVYLTIKSLLQLVHGEPVDSRVPKPYFEVEGRLQRVDEDWEAMLKEAYDATGRGKRRGKL